MIELGRSFGEVRWFDADTTVEEKKKKGTLTSREEYVGDARQHLNFFLFEVRKGNR